MYLLLTLWTDRIREYWFVIGWKPVTTDQSCDPNNALGLVYYPIRSVHTLYLNRKVSPVYIVPEKKVSCWFRRTSNLKQLHQVIKLTVNISTNWNTNYNLGLARKVLESLLCACLESLKNHLFYKLVFGLMDFSKFSLPSGCRREPLLWSFARTRESAKK